MSRLTGLPVTRNSRLPTVRRAHRLYFPFLLERAPVMMRDERTERNRHFSHLVMSLARKPSSIANRRGADARVLRR